MTSPHPLSTKLNNAQEHLSSEEIDGWLLYDYRGMNPIFADTVGAIANVTRPCWLWVPVSGGRGCWCRMSIRGALSTWASRRCCG